MHAEPLEATMVGMQLLITTARSAIEFCASLLRVTLMCHT